MPRVAWLTDLHLNFVDESARQRFYAAVQASGAEAVVISGDIGEARSVTGLLTELDERLEKPLYFVLGNHDFYFGSIAGVRAAVDRLCAARPRLIYLTSGGVFPLSSGVAMVGHDGWADGRVGDYERSYVMMNDYRLIQELAGCSKQERWPRLMALGDAAAGHLRRVLPVALESFPEVLVITHVPPWREACWYQGRLSDDEWAPHFTCQAVGDAISEVMQPFPHRQLTVLCGHTHSPGEAEIAPNIRVLTGGAAYGEPDICGILNLP
jgi:3',5'-cyclic AMP phosphodiesterase CpdA